MDAIGKGIKGAWDIFTGGGSAGDVAKAAAVPIFEMIADDLRGGVKSLAVLLAGWILIPSTEICPGASLHTRLWMEQCPASGSPAAELRRWMLPLTVLIAVAGIVWQGIVMAVSRKGEPLMQAIRGTWNTALWGAVGISGTQLALMAGDDYSYWILKQAIIGDSTDPVNTMGTKIAEMAVPEAGIALFVLILLMIPILFMTVLQILMMIFREGSVVILAGMLQLAAAGTFTRATGGWLQKVLSWMLALVAYKPIAATVYATGVLLMGSSGLRNFVMGLAVMVLAIVAMPALMKFFNWTVGSLNSDGGGLAALGALAGAGPQAAGSLYGAGGFSAKDHANYMEQHGPSGSRSGPSPSSGSPPGSPTEPGPPQPGPASPGGAAGGIPTVQGSAGTATATGVTSSGAAGAATAGAAGGAAATGVGIPIAAGIVAAQGIAHAGKKAANTVADSTQGGQ